MFVYVTKTDKMNKELSFVDEGRVLVRYDLPLAEVVEGFYDQVKHEPCSPYLLFLVLFLCLSVPHWLHLTCLSLLLVLYQPIIPP